MDHRNLTPIKSTVYKEEPDDRDGFCCLLCQIHNQDSEQPTSLEAWWFQSDDSDEYGLEESFQILSKTLSKPTSITVHGEVLGY